MIVIRIELWSAITNKVKPLAIMSICNDGTGTNSKGNYTAQLWSADGKKGRIGHVEKHAATPSVSGSC